MKGNYPFEIIFLSDPVSFNGQSYNKQRGLDLVTSLSSGYETSSKNFFIIYYQIKFDGIKSSGFWVTIPKLTPANLFKPIHDVINYSTYICSLECGKCGKEEEKLQKSEYLENEKSFLDGIKNIFHSFWRVIMWWKNKNLIKDSGHKLQWCEYFFWKIWRLFQYQIYFSKFEVLL